jgi:hypothetical protein
VSESTVRRYIATTFTEEPEDKVTVLRGAGSEAQSTTGASACDATPASGRQDAVWVFAKRTAQFNEKDFDSVNRLGVTYQIAGDCFLCCRARRFL